MRELFEARRIACPNCGRHHIEIDEFKPYFDGEYAIVPFYCHDCGTTWNAVYKFSNNEEIDILENN